MDQSRKKKSPLERLVEAQQEQASLVKADKSKKVLDTEVEPDSGISTNQGDQNLVISNSSLNVNFNLNVDSEAMDRAVQASSAMAKKIAAAGAAFLGTALIVGNNSNKKTLDKVKIHLEPKTKIPDFKLK